MEPRARTTRAQAAAAASKGDIKATEPSLANNTGNDGDTTMGDGDGEQQPYDIDVNEVDIHALDSPSRVPPAVNRTSPSTINETPSPTTAAVATVNAPKAAAVPPATPTIVNNIFNGATPQPTVQAPIPQLTPILMSPVPAASATKKSINVFGVFVGGIISKWSPAKVVGSNTFLNSLLLAVWRCSVLFGTVQYCFVFLYR